MLTIEQVKENPSLESEFIEQNIPFVHYFVKRYAADNEYDDYVQIGCMAMLQAIRKFDPNKGVKFNSYASMAINNNIRDYYNKKREKHLLYDVYLSDLAYSDNEEFTYEDIIPSVETVDSTFNCIQLKEVFRRCYSQLSNNYKRIIRLYISGSNQNEIALRVHFSQSYVSRVISRFKEKIRKGIT